MPSPLLFPNLSSLSTPPRGMSKFPFEKGKSNQHVLFPSLGSEEKKRSSPGRTVLGVDKELLRF